MKVHVETAGDKSAPPIIFVHGAGGSAATWMMQLRGLSDKLNVTVIELNGHGKTLDRNEVDVTKSYLEDIHEIVLEYNNPILAGHSMGGALTQLYAINHSENLRGIILVGSGAKLRVTPLIFDMLEEDFDGYVNAVGNFMFYEGTSRELVEASKAEVRKCNPMIISRDFKVCNEFDIMDKVSEITLPTLIIVGQHDIMTPTKYSQYLNNMIDNSTLNIIKNAGHAVMLEQSSSFNKAVIDWLEELDSS